MSTHDESGRNRESAHVGQTDHSKTVYRYFLVGRVVLRFTQTVCFPVFFFAFVSNFYVWYFSGIHI